MSGRIALNRLTKDLKQLRSDPGLADIHAEPKGDDLFHWEATIPGPAGTPYEGGSFRVDITFPPEYPFKPPKVQLTTRVYHCNIGEDGRVCLSVLQSNEWAPNTPLARVLGMLRQLLAEPDADSPLVGDIAMQFKNDRVQHDATARRFTADYAKPLTTAEPAAERAAAVAHWATARRTFRTAAAFKSFKQVEVAMRVERALSEVAALVETAATRETAAQEEELQQVESQLATIATQELRDLKAAEAEDEPGLAAVPTDKMREIWGQVDEEVMPGSHALLSWACLGSCVSTHYSMGLHGGRARSRLTRLDRCGSGRGSRGSTARCGAGSPEKKEALPP
jgi:ubiquitin-conjugating enzyme E2 D/E